MKGIKIVLLAFLLGSSALLLAFPSHSVPPATLLVPYSDRPIDLAHLDGDPATGAWSDATTALVPLENGQPEPYGSANVWMKHDGSFLYVRIDGSMDVPWTSSSGTHFWLGFLLCPATVTGHHKAGQDWVFFGETSYGALSYPLTPIDAYGSSKPPAKDSSQDVEGRLQYRGSAAPYAFTAEFRRPLDSGDPEDVALVPDATTAYAFAITTDSNGKGSSGGSIDHAVVTNENVLRLERPRTGDTEPPVVAIEAPANGSEVQGLVTVRVSASDNVGVERVELFVNETLLGEDSTAPYEFQWNTTGLRNGPYRLTATAYDPSFNKGSSWIDVTVANPDTEPPVADAGPDWSVPPGTMVTFDGSRSTDNQGVVNWTWTFTDLGPVTLYGRTATYTFEREGHYLVTLTVWDAAGNSDEDTLWVNVTADVAPPVARAGADQEVLPGTLVTLDGSASTDDVGIENYTWTFTDIHEVRLYGPVVTYPFEREGHYLITLTVRDYAGKEASDSLWVNVTVGVDWSAIPEMRVRTSEGPFVQEILVQVAAANGRLLVRARFAYAASPADPEAVYFAVEFDRSRKGFPMSAGDEMLIASRKGPDGQPATQFDFFVLADQSRPTPIAGSDATRVTYQVQNSDYEIVLARSLRAMDLDRQVDLTPGTTVAVAFAVGEWGRGSAHAYTLMQWQLVVTEEGVTLVALAGGIQAGVYALAKDLGLAMFLVTLALVAFHFLRRRAWVGKHPVEVYCGAAGKVEVERHGLGIRLVHWTHVGLMLTFIVTGYGIFTRNPPFGAATVPVHIAASFAILAIDYPLQFFFMWRSHEFPFLFVPRKDDIRVALSLLGNFFGLTRAYEEHATVDPETKGWYRGRKYCSFQKGLLLMDLVAIFVMALTGYALYWPGGFPWLYDFLRPWGGYFAIRGLHLLMFYYFVSTLVGHVYLSLIPMNWGKMRSMILGKGKIHLHSTAPPPGTVPTTGEASSEPR